MTNIASAIALAQLENIENKLLRKKEIAKKYKEGIKSSRFKLFDPNPELNLSSYWMNILLTKSPNESKILVKHLKNNNIETRPLFKPVHLMKPYKQFYRDRLIASEKISGCGINLPSFPSLKNEQIEIIVNTVNNLH